MFYTHFLIYSSPQSCSLVLLLFPFYIFYLFLKPKLKSLRKPQSHKVRKKRFKIDQVVITDMWRIQIRSREDEYVGTTLGKIIMEGWKWKWLERGSRVNNGTRASQSEGTSNTKSLWQEGASCVFKGLKKKKERKQAMWPVHHEQRGECHMMTYKTEYGLWNRNFTYS